MFIVDKFFVKMSDIGFHSLPIGKLYKKIKQRRLKSSPAGYVGSFCSNLADNVDNFLGFDFYGQIANDYNILQKMFENIFLPRLISPKVCKLTSIIT